MRDTLLLACGSHNSRASLRVIFEESYNLLEAETGKQARLLLEQNANCIAAVLLDLTVRNKGGTFLLKELSSDPILSEVPLLVLLDKNSPINESVAFSLGVYDVIHYPCDPLIVQSRVQTVVSFIRHKWHLQELLNEQTDVLRHSNEVMVDTLSSIIEYRSVESGQHILRIRHFTRILLEEVARSCPEYGLTNDLVSVISSAAALHDIGKISIPDSILNKPGLLTEDEWKVMRTHAITGCRILESLAGTGNETYLRYAHNICHYHHERWDGGGYPEGIAGNDIPICAQVVGLADAYDALTSERVYKKAYSFDQAANMILAGECGQFSPQLLECFKQVSPRMAALAREYADGLSPKSDMFDIPLPGPSLQPGQDTLHLSQMRYHALLHYVNATVIEADLDHGLYHLVYNPDPVLAVLSAGLSFEEASSIILDQLVYPDDQNYLRQVYREEIPRFLEAGLRRQSFFFRFNGKTPGEPLHYCLTLLRVNLSDPTAHKLLILWTKDDAGSNPSADPTIPVWRDEFSGENVFSSVACFACCRNDRRLSLVHFGTNFAALVGYSEAELHSVSENSLLALIHPEDRDRTLEMLSDQLSHSPNTELEFRLCHRDGHYIWVLTKSRLIPAADGTEFLYSVILDVSRSMERQEALHEMLERQQIILSQTRNVIFEWDPIADTMRYFGDWHSLFGYAPLEKDFLASLDTASHFHPEDIPAIRALLEAIKTGEEYRVAEVRLATADGHYIWCRFRVTACFGEDGLPERAVGLITNIDREKRSSQLLQSRAERDSLTKLLNRDSARRYIEEYLSSGAEHAALLIIDLDNFKQVNDRYGHMFGDAILSQAASYLRKLFRADDVVARIGGDEFLVLMKETPSVSLVRDRCRQLIDGFRQLLQGLAPDCVLSCSAGVALYPDHGSLYTELFPRADRALYLAKSQGKNAFHIYEVESLLLTPLHRSASAINERIDSNEHPGLAENSLVQYALQRLYETNNIDETINHILSVVGQQMNVSRVYIFENSPDNKYCSNTFEWCNEGISPEIQNLQNISYEHDIPSFEHIFNEHGIWYCSDISTLPEDLYNILAPQGIKALLHCSIRDRGKFRGYIGFDDCFSTRLWTQEQIDALTFFSEMLAVFLLKHRAQEETRRYAADLVNVLDNQNAWIYVIDPEDCTLLFLNAKTKTLAPDAAIGMKCYHCLMGRESRCSECPATNISTLKSNHMVIENLYLGKTVDAEASLLRWNGRDSCLMSCRPLRQDDHKS